MNSLWPRSLKCFDLTLADDAENLALDEALLSAVEADPTAACLRFWIAARHFVVLGRSNQAELEVNIQVCRELGIPILRRVSGGGTVLVGPGCLCYSLVLPIIDEHRQLGISGVTAELMSRNAAGLSSILSDVKVCGTSDLADSGQKFSGNAQRWLKQAFIHHGTLLFDFDLALVQRCLSHPTREPVYRNARRHDEFVKNISRTPDELRACLSRVWNAEDANCPSSLLHESSKIAGTRYQSAEWLVVPRP